MIRAVIFDVGGVLVLHDDEDIIRLMADSIGVSPEAAEDAISKLRADFQKGKLTDREFWGKFSEILGLPMPKYYEKLWSKDYSRVSKRNENVIKIKDRIRRNYKVGILSNTIKSHVECNRKMNVYDGFDAVVLSNEVGMRKPEKEIYIYTAKKLGARPDECVFIDDAEEFLEPAQKLGMKTILFRDAKQLESDLRSLGIKL